jgi:lipid-A-disaccharide synthase
MIDAWRSTLYPLGFVAIAFFSLRFFVQWLASERQKKSFVPPVFWKLSLIGNLLLALHALIQVQYHVSIIQACSVVLAWRNLNLYRPAASQSSIYWVIFFLFLAALLTTLLFLAQAFLICGHFDWVRTPVMPWNDLPAEKLSIWWHLLGSSGLVLFASRFWIQWIQAERFQKSDLGATFWWISIAGTLISLIYFIRLNDTVHIVSFGLALIPYIRNLQLLRKERVD